MFFFVLGWVLFVLNVIFAATNLGIFFANGDPLNGVVVVVNVLAALGIWVSEMLRTPEYYGY